MAVAGEGDLARRGMLEGALSDSWKSVLTAGLWARLEAGEKSSCGRERMVILSMMSAIASTSGANSSL